MVDPERYAHAARRFKAFFEELRSTFVERDDTLEQIMLALLCREHALMTGPPGTAKSQLARAVLGRIIDEKTGQPSLFASQFTENTVQTDLVGAIDFKTLMETGRTEHFTDEGILGAVHAFLDEVFDGRDMLLRSTLNLLHERELKQGQSTARGAIECAVMTSNRYISEILEDSKDTLLAFIDRVAFISFTPRGFANARNLTQVVTQHGGGLGRHTLSAPLSVQDLDVLQAQVEEIYVSSAMCEGLVTLIQDLDQQLSAAARADPAFVPTRYLSTRTIIRATSVLRAGVLLNQIFKDPKRPLEAKQQDLTWLHLYLLLGGPDLEQIGQILERENDPRERRQLEIMRTEQEIFRRCLDRLAPIPHEPRPVVPLDALRTEVEALRTTGDIEKTADLTFRLVQSTESGASEAPQAEALLKTFLSDLTDRALRIGLSPINPKRNVHEIVHEMAELADAIERVGGTRTLPTAHWLRGRAVELLDQSLVHVPSNHEAILRVAKKSSGTNLTKYSIERLRQAKKLLALRERLIDEGALLSDQEATKAHRELILEHIETEQVMIWNEFFQIVVDRHRPDLARLISSLTRGRKLFDEMHQRLGLLNYSPNLKNRVVSPRLETVLATHFESLEAHSREDVIDEAKKVVQQLEEAGLDQSMDPSMLLAAVAEALCRMAMPPPPPEIRHLTNYESSTALDNIASVTAALLDVATVLHSQRGLNPETPNAATETVLVPLRILPPAIQDLVVRADFAHISRSIARLESWWSYLRTHLDPDPTLALETLMESGFFKVMSEQHALLDPLVEARQVIEVFSTRADIIRPLIERIERFEETYTQGIEKLLEARHQSVFSAETSTADDN